MKRFPKTISSSERQESVLDESRILVAFKKVTEIKEVQSIAKTLKLKVEIIERVETTKHWVQINNTNQRYWLRSLDDSPVDEEEFAQIEKKLGDKVDWIAPVYRNPNERGSENYFSPIPTVLLIKKGKQDKIKQIIEEFGLN